MTVRVLVGDALSVLRTLPAESVQLCVTSPPYYGLRAYGTEPQVWGGDPEHGHEWGDGIEAPNSSARWGKPSDTTGFRNGKSYANDALGHLMQRSAFCPCGAWRGELGSEPTPALFIEHLLLIFDEVWRVLRPDGLVFCNLGDSYSGSGKGPTGHNGLGDAFNRQGFGNDERNEMRRGAGTRLGIPAKNLLLVPQRFAIAMQERGWIVRSEIVWAKTSAMPESVRDRPTSAWEPIWMFSKQAKYFYDGDAVRTELSPVMQQQMKSTPPSAYRHATKYAETGLKHSDEAMASHFEPMRANGAGANLRNVWTLGPSPFADAHFATFPPEIPRRCILAGSRRGDTVLDPFLGSGTTALVADRLGRDAIGIELNAEYAEMARKRIEQDAGTLFGDPVSVEQPQQIDLFGEASG